MGVQLHDLDFLLQAMNDGLRIDSVVLLGQQTLYVETAELAMRLRWLGLGLSALAAAVACDSEAPDPLGLGPGRGLLMRLLMLLGARRVEVLDVSSYDGATLIQDLNRPVDPSLHEAFDLVYDGGTLEHVFNFPTAIANCMAMVRPGGHLLLHAPANNQFGHGFYQFSPELFFRVLSPEYGFTIERLLARNAADGGTYDVADPADVGARIELVSDAPIQLLVKARKLASVPLFETFPQQSDYVALWRRPSVRADERDLLAEERASRQRLMEMLGRVAAAVSRVLRAFRRHGPKACPPPARATLENRRFFRPI